MRDAQASFELQAGITQAGEGAPPVSDGISAEEVGGEVSTEKTSANTLILFAVVVLACAIGALSQTATSSMLSGIDATFGITEAVGQWLTTAYMLVIGITVPVVTHMSRKMSVRKIACVSIAFYVFGCAIDAVAPSFMLLLAGRVFQAISTGVTMTLLQTIAMTRFPKGKNGTAMGVAGMAMGFAPNIGPLIGGALVDLSWRYFFIFMGAIGAILLLTCLLGVKSEPNPNQQSVLDMPSLLLSTLGFGGLLLAFTNAASVSIASAEVVVPFVIGAGLSVAFVIRQGKLKFPLIDMKIFRSKCYVNGFVAMALLNASFMGITLILPLFIINISSLSAVESGLVFLPATIMALFVNPISGYLLDRCGARVVLLVSSALLSIGAISMIFVDATTPLWLLALMQLVRGLGVSGLMGPLSSYSLSDLPGPLVVHGSAFLITGRQVCASFGTACMMLAVTSVGASAATTAAGAMTAAGFSAAFGLSAAFAILTLVVCAVKVR